ncbi:TetR/AcrR family transcriptional regulator [[Mycobacterium] holstebronense]|uniref:TetR/AcrR family transcriptional regulator n=1 Tax=[Mycobacterium] holstebronense TaxID=3064288 RepID=A0ABM9M259_9MYCO|nr:TetR/AcrR family transcriptional regulator [Mycolicibacter sp. MU0102]CAJ1508873.1 TetR/AcrR family transcriptional regulator [Mycolicibacter sp. MU0102]
MTPDSANQWRGTSSAERADDRRQRLIDACVEVLGRDGASGLGVRAVCRVANVSHRYFYDLFPDTDALLLAAYQQAVQQLLAEVGSAINASGTDIREQLRVGFDAATAFLEENPAYGRLIFQEALANEALRRHAAPALPAFLLAAREMAEPGGTSAAHPLETALISGGLAAIFIEWLSGTAAFSRSELVDYCTDSMMAILFLGRRPPK